MKVSIVFFILTIMLIIVFITYSIWFMRHRDNIIHESGYIMLMWMFTITIVFFIVFTFSFYKGEQKTETALNRINDGWEIYLDGRQVEIENIDIEEYNITFNEDAEKIILSH